MDTPEEQSRNAALWQSVNDQLERNNQIQAAHYDLMKKMAEAQGINVSSLNRSKTAYDGLYGATTKQTAAGEANAHGLDVMNQAMAQFDKAAISGTAATFAFGKALLSTEKSFAKYNDVLKNAGTAAWEASKNFGLLGMATGALIKGVTMAAEMATKQADDVLKASDELSKMGVAGGMTAKELLDMGHNAGYTAAQLGVITKATKSMGTDMMALGGNVKQSVKEFGVLTNVGDDVYASFQRLGVSQEDLTQNQADYIKLQASSGKLITEQMKRDGSLKAASLEYTKNLLELSAITGKSMEESKKAMEKSQANFDIMIKTQNLEEEKNRLLNSNNEGDKERGKQIERELKANEAMLLAAEATGDAQFLAATQSRIATGAWTESSTVLLRTLPNFEELQKGLKEGSITQADYMKAIAEGTQRQRKEFGTAGSFGKETADTFGLSVALMQNSAKILGKDLPGALKEAKADIEAAAEGTGKGAGTDPAQIARNELTKLERDAAIELDKLVAKMNPLINGFDKTTTAATMLAAAAGLAAIALTAMAGLSALKDLKGLKDIAGKGLPGKGMPGGGTTPPASPKPSGMSGAEKEKYDKLRKEGMSASEAKRQAGGFKSLVSAETKITGGVKPVIPSIPVGAATETLAKEASVLGKMGGALGAASKFAGPAAGAVSVLAGGYSAYQGSKAVDEKVKTGEITKDEGTVQKSEAVGKGAGSAIGGLGGAALGAAIGTAVFPVVGTAIGAALGGWLFAKGGEMVGENVGTAVGKSLTSKPIDVKTDASGRANAANDPRTVGTATNPAPVKPTDKTTDASGRATAANDPRLKNPEAEDPKNITKGMADMVKEDAAKRAEAQKKSEQAQEVTIGTLNKTLLATNTALTNLTASITNLTKPTTTGNMAGGAMPGKASGGGISVPSGVPTSFKASGGGSAMSGGMSGDMPKTSKPSSQPAEGSENGTGSASKAVDLTKIMKFGSGSGTQQNFEELNSTFKDAVTAAATEYNAVTGSKLTINSAKRDPEDQQRLWDESVAAGRPGKGPTGMAIGKPGRSLHEKGEAVDIQNYKDPDAVNALNKQGLTQKVPGDPVHFQALEGGELNGPKSGYPVEGTMHGREAIIPLNPDSIITKLLDTNESQLKTETNNNNITSTTKDDVTAQMIASLHEMMAEKFDAMIDILEDGNDHTEKLVRFSAV